MDLPQAHLNLIEKAKVVTRARLHRKAVGVNPRSNNREMTLTNHPLPPTHLERVPWKEDKNWSNPRPTAAHHRYYYNDILYYTILYYWYMKLLYI
jgi:hypothetical protein